jgi:hypothetical protein
MGRSEWAIRVTSNDDIERVLKFIDEQNSSPDSGEGLVLTCLLRFNDKIWACVVNGGGRDETSNFLNNWFQDSTEIYYPFQKPAGWDECVDYIWSRTSQTSPLVL